MGLRDDDLAILSARVGVARFGASRFGFYPDDVEGSGTEEPGEYIWKEDKPPTTLWTLQSLYSFCGERPTALFTSSSCASVDSAITFTDASTPTDSVSYWYWTFGDGDDSYDQNPSHTYSAAGAYTVTLYVSGPRGSASYSATISVITLSIAADNETPAADEDVNFTSTVVGGVEPYTYAWDFGDELGDSSEENPTYAYPSAGSYVATLTVTDDQGCEKTDTVSITVSASTANVSGNVTYDGGPVWVGGSVYMTVDAVPWPAGPATTDGSGDYLFEDVPGGAIVVSISGTPPATGYREGQNSGTLSPPSNLVLDIDAVGA